ncbi:uncharacterized protein LOC125789942 [Astyanax mexicanus]|uniref:uncharacterized protein LOC125789942 n=1 Tax=Astyanax mexicanus TaxID=7994 RepID=UPI0020CACD6E|nr:uncharacterized protein LOC125789942 [Astyanax mexicanus]
MVGGPSRQVAGQGDSLTIPIRGGNLQPPVCVALLGHPGRQEGSLGPPPLSAAMVDHLLVKFPHFLLIFTAVCGVSSYVPHRYHFVNENKTWTEAQSYCRKTYTDLATINNMDEMKKLNETLKDKTVGDVWIGLNRGNTGKWRWSPDELILIQQNLSWKGALRYCRENHVDLVSVHSEEIQLWVKDVAQKASTDHVWLGLRHTCTQGFWFWTSGFTICYENWAPGNGAEGEHCEPIERTGAVQARGDQKWVSLPENQNLNFICIRYEG